MVNPKLVTLPTLQEHLASITPAKKVVCCSGSFDLLHSGHISYLREAKAHGDILVVLLNSDESIQLYKGIGRPILKFSERSQILAAIAGVDYIVELDALNPLYALSQIKPAVYCNGSDWGAQAIERTLIEAQGGTYLVVSPQTRSLFSTTDIITRIIDTRTQVPRRGIFLDLRHQQPSREDIETITSLAESDFLVFATNHADGHPLNLAANFFSFSVSPLESFPPSTENLETYATTHALALSQSWLCSDDYHQIASARCANMKTMSFGDSVMPDQNSLYVATAHHHSLTEALQALLELSK